MKNHILAIGTFELKVVVLRMPFYKVTRDNSWNFFQKCYAESIYPKGKTENNNSLKTCGHPVDRALIVSQRFGFWFQCMAPFGPTAGFSADGRSGSRKRGGRRTPSQGRCRWARNDELELHSWKEGPGSYVWESPPNDTSPRHKIWNIQNHIRFIQRIWGDDTFDTCNETINMIAHLQYCANVNT